MKMEYRRLGTSGLEVSPLCLGTMTFGDHTDAADVAAHRRCRRIDAGVNFIDTADAYGNGASETNRRSGDQGRTGGAGFSRRKSAT